MATGLTVFGIVVDRPAIEDTTGGPTIDDIVCGRSVGEGELDLLSIFHWQQCLD